MLTLFLFQRELSHLKKEYRATSDTVIKSQILKDIELLSAAIEEIGSNNSSESNTTTKPSSP